MGKDNLFHQKRSAENAELIRRHNLREIRKRYLIVTEGKKTEVNYFRDLCADKRINADVEVVQGKLGNTPDQLIAYAKMRQQKEKKAGDAFDKIFCVFDRDSHATFEQAKNQLGQMKEPFIAIYSEPCFEYWLLLHFHYTRKPFVSGGNKSCCDSVIAELKKQEGFEHYTKGGKDIYNLTKDHLQTAIDNAHKAERDARETSETNPSTNLPALIAELVGVAN